MEKINDCSNCISLQKVYKHPRNKEIGRGAMSELLGYACSIFQGRLIFKESPNGECECFVNKEEN